MAGLGPKAEEIEAGGTPRWWSLSVDDTVHSLSADPERGLSTAEADRRKRARGPNRLPEKARFPAPGILLRQFSSFLIWVLIAAAGVAWFTGEKLDAGVILAVVALNAGLGFAQEYRAEKSLEFLRRLSTPTSKIFRDGVLRVFPSEDIVPGDLLLLEAGDRVPADGRWLWTARLSVQESALTGESMPVEKTSEALPDGELALGDRADMSFMGTVAVAGKGRLLVTATGLGTELGRIAALLEQAPPETTPLQAQLRRLGRWLGGFFLAVVALVFVLGVARDMPTGAVLLISMSLAVAAIPEGLPAVVTMTLAAGVRRMARRNAIIRRLPSVETLGCASVICTDKTGTLTRNEMTVRRLWANGRVYEVSGVGYAPDGAFHHGENEILLPEHPELLLALKIGVLCSGASLVSTEEGWRAAGDPTEAALLTAAGKAGLWKEGLEPQHPAKGEVPFDSERKRMSVLRRTPEGSILFVKGAPDVLLKRCARVFLEGRVQPLTPALKARIENANAALAGQALRVLGVAYRDVKDHQEAHEGLEEDLVFVGLLAMMDSPRPEAKESVALCKRAGIRTVMITGDHRATAAAVAREIGLMEEGQRAVDGPELDAMDDAALAASLRSIAVYARASAAHKLRIVRAWKAAGGVVAMTGDGVNDAPALKEADIGVAMGITGTDVAKEASDMVITDDNFASVVHAVEEGRVVYDNIHKFVNYLLSTNIAEVLVIAAGLALGLADAGGRVFAALSAVQLLWLNLLSDGLPALSLGLDRAAPMIMDRPPRDPAKPLMSGGFTTQLLAVGAIVAAGTLAASYYGAHESAVMAQTMAMTSLVAMEMVRVQVIRAGHGLSLFSNPWVPAALASSLLMQLVILYVPVLRETFGTAPLGAADWGFVAAATGAAWLGAALFRRIAKKGVP